MSVADLRDNLRAKYGKPVLTATDVPVPTETSLDVERAFVVTGASGRTVITAPIREVASSNPGFLYLKGRMVGADEPNLNGAFWSSEDLQLGQATVAGGPVNWIHDDSHIVGALTGGEFVQRDGRAFIESSAVVWKFLFPKEAAVIEEAAAKGLLSQSMECVAREVQCMDSPDGTMSGCGDRVSYNDYLNGHCCSHLAERSSMRRLIDPTFLGTAIIVPPVQPADSHASLEVVRQAAQTVERSNLTSQGLSRAQAEALVQTVLTWANRA